MNEPLIYWNGVRWAELPIGQGGILMPEKGSLIINGIDFDKKLDDLKRSIHAQIDREIEIQQRLRYLISTSDILAGFRKGGYLIVVGKPRNRKTTL